MICEVLTNRFAVYKDWTDKASVGESGRTKRRSQCGTTE